MPTVQTIEKITLEQLRALGVQALSDRPNAANSYGQTGMNATALKKWFDNMPKLLLEKINQLLDVLSHDDAAQYIKLALEEYGGVEFSGGIETLQDLIDSFLNGVFANELLKLKPNAELSSSLATLQSIINSIAASIATHGENIGDLQSDAVSLDHISISTSASNIVTLSFKNGSDANLKSFEIDLNVGTSKLQDGAVTTDKIADSAVTTDKIRDESVTADKMATASVGSTAIQDNAVVGRTIANGSVSTDKIATESVTTNKIADGAVTEDKLASSAVTEAKISAAAIIESKLASALKGKINGSIVGVTFTGSTGVLKFVTNDGSEISIDLPTELIVGDGSYYDDTPGEEAIVLVLANGDEIKIPITQMLADIYTYIDGIREKIFDLQEAPPLSALESALLLVTPTIQQLADL